MKVVLVKLLRAVKLLVKDGEHCERDTDGAALAFETDFHSALA
jgi:hypothetical protein